MLRLEEKGIKLEPGSKIGMSIAIIFLILFLFVSFYSIVINPLLKPWWAQQEGKAELAQAEQNRQIAILEAKAKKESAELLAQAEVERAKGVAEANKIIAKSIDENYLRYLFVQGLQTNQMQTIYVPMNGFMPVWEMGRN